MLHTFGRAHEISGKRIIPTELVNGVGSAEAIRPGCGDPTGVALDELIVLISLEYFAMLTLWEGVLGYGRNPKVCGS
jgi:hypothetical protein